MSSIELTKRELYIKSIFLPENKSQKKIIFQKKMLTKLLKPYQI